MKEKKVTVSGVVERKHLYKGSKSEGTFIVLTKDDGSFLHLRAPEEAPRGDNAFSQFVGKRVKVDGRKYEGADNLLFVSSLDQVQVVSAPKIRPAGKKLGGMKM